LAAPLAAVPPPTDRHRRPALALAALLVLAILALVLWQEWLRRPEVVTVAAPPAVADPEIQRRADQLARLNEGLAGRLAGLKDPPTICPPGTRAPDQPPSQVAPQRRGGAVPTTTPTLTTRALTERLEAATALVLTAGQSSTGFFIAPTLLVTNRHAVADAADARVLVTSRALGRVHPARVRAASPAGPTGALDFALIELMAGTAPGTLPLGLEVDKLQPVVAAGYPGLSLANDLGFRRLLAGDPRAAPDLNLTPGAVQALQRSAQGVATVVHSAVILQGSSGGPLVDGCGRVVAINTYIAVDAEQSGRTSFALASADLAAFLTQAGVAPPLADATCAP
jgi:S1-C subfamily serine protease